jgi:hypothetical protein
MRKLVIAIIAVFALVTFIREYLPVRAASADLQRAAIESHLPN